MKSLLRQNALCLLALCVSVLLLCPVRVCGASNGITIRVLSGRPEMVSGGDALVRVEAPVEVSLANLQITVNGIDISTRFRKDEDAHALTGLVTGLVEGKNTIAVRQRDSEAVAPVRLELINHPITGPIFAGPKETPFFCETESFKLPGGKTLGPPLDGNCSIATRVDYFYRSTLGGALRPVPDPQHLPADVARIPTPFGKTVPYVVRLETGTIDRAIYQIAMLHDPEHEPAPDFSTPPMGWNGRLIYNFGGGCMTGWYRQGSKAGRVDDDFLLRQGYALASSSLNYFGNNCDDVLASEALAMVKEHFVKRYGIPKFTIGMGCSGGAEQVYPIAQNYPGLLDGIIAGCSFPEVDFAMAEALSDARLLNHYFNKASQAYSIEQKLAVTGFLSLENVVKADAQYAGRITVGEFCPSVLPATMRYDQETNPRGARCDLYDHAVNIYGRDEKTGFARRPLDNVGIQYGLAALNAGVISKEQFLDLNEKVGGFDQDGKIASRRTEADLAAVRAAYLSGRMTTGAGGLATTPVIDYRAYADDDPAGNPHLRFHSFIARARLLKTNGYFDNQVMLVEDRRYQLFSTESPVLRFAIREMDQWLTNLAQDTTSGDAITKLRRAKPAELVDSCWTRDAVPQRIIEEQVFGAGRCEKIYPAGSFPRAVAGSPLAADIIKCQLKPVDPADYRVSFRPDEMARLKRIFPEGVCDWSKPGVGQQPLAGTWLTYDSGGPLLPDDRNGHGAAAGVVASTPSDAEDRRGSGQQP